MPNPESVTPLSLTPTSMAVNQSLPLTAVPTGSGTLCTVDNYTTDNDLVIPSDANWALFSGSVDFLVAYGTATDTFPAALPAAGAPLTPDPDTSGSGTLIEVSPGLRYVGDLSDKNIKVRGLGDGQVSVVYYK